MLKGFKDFLLRGNVIDLAVGIVIGTAFAAVIKGLTDGFLTPLIALIFGQPDISKVLFTVNGTEFPIGLFLQALLNFVMIAAALYFFVVVPVNHFAERVKRGQAAPPEEVPSEDVALLKEIRDLLSTRA